MRSKSSRAATVRGAVLRLTPMQEVTADDRHDETARTPPYRKIGEDLFRPLSGMTRKYFAAILIPLLVILFGAYAWTVQLRLGMGVTGLQRPVFWGFYIVDFVFWIGISHAGTLISAILRLTDAGWRKPIARP